MEARCLPDEYHGGYPMKKELAQSMLVSGMLAALVIGGERTACAGDMTFRPYLTVGEEFTDNVYESSGNKRTDYITRVQPGASVRYLSPRLDLDTAYSFEYRYYARGGHGDEYNHNADLKGTITLIDNFMFLDLHDSYHRVSLDVTRDPATESSYFLDQTDENRATISPYLLWRLGEKTTLKTGYRYTDVRYWGEGIERREHGGYAELNHELTSKLTLTGGYAFTHLMSDSLNYDNHDVYGGFRYNYAENSFLFAQVGNTWQNFEHGRSDSYIFWNAGLTHDFSVLKLTLETRVQNSSDPQYGANSGSSATYSSIDPLHVSTKQTLYRAQIDKPIERGSLSMFISYTDYDYTDNSEPSYYKYSVGASGRYEVLPDLNVGISVIGERTVGQINQYYNGYYYNNYPYRLSGSLNVAYAFNHDLSLSVTYIYTTNRYHFDSGRDSADTNRAIVELRKNF